MVQITPSAMDCCRPCCRDQVTVVISGGGERQVYNGHGSPIGVFAPANTAIANIYYDLDDPGVTYDWDTVNQVWS